MARYLADTLKKKIWLIKWKLTNRQKQSFDCPVCHYHGPFKDVNRLTGIRRHAKCPSCGSLERLRLQYLVVEKVLSGVDIKNDATLHFAPEPFFQNFFSGRCCKYWTADLQRNDVDILVDIQHLPIEKQSFDFIFASHVLEHVPDDRKALKEIQRVLRPGGIAFLPVPVIGITTVEYSSPNPFEEYHVRAPGLDYFDRYDQIFSKVARYTSESFSERYQLYVYEDRTRWDKERFPERPTMDGERHQAICPVCYV